MDSTRSLTVENGLNQSRLVHGIRGVETPAGASKIVSVGWLIAVLVVGVQTAAQLINAFVLAHPHPGLDAGVDRNVFDWASFCASLVAVLSLLLLAVAGAGCGRSAVILALLVAFFAVDDLSNLHDYLGSAFARMLPEPFDRLGDWSTPVLYLPLLGATFGLLRLRGTRAAPGPARQIWAALALLAAAVALRVLVGILEVRGFHASTGTRAIGVGVLEAAELGAWTLLAAAFVAEGERMWFVEQTRGGKTGRVRVARPCRVRAPSGLSREPTGLPAYLARLRGLPLGAAPSLERRRGRRSPAHRP